MHPDKPAHAMVRAGLELLGLRPAVEDEVNGPFLWPRLPPCLPRSPGPQELVLLQDYRSLAFSIVLVSTGTASQRTLG